MSKGWRAVKAQFDIKTRRTLPNLVPSERAKKTQGNTSSGSFGRHPWKTDSALVVLHIHTHAQPKSVFARAMTVMDKIERWEEEEEEKKKNDKWVGRRRNELVPVSQCACGSTQKALICNGQVNTQEYLMQRFRSVMEGVTWVCDDALEDHVWVSELTISRQETEVSGGS